MNTIIVAWLLFLATQYEKPIGAFTDRAECEKVSKEIIQSVKIRSNCVPVTQSVLAFYAGKCLGNEIAAQQTLAPVCGYDRKKLKQEEGR